MADHNDPNALNAAFSDIQAIGADLYDVYGYPVQGEGGEESVVVALTCSSIPNTGVFDPDLLYRLQFYTHPRIAHPWHGEHTLESLLQALEGAEGKFFGEFSPAEIRVTPEAGDRAHLELTGFPGGDISQVVATNEVLTLQAPGGQAIKVFVGGRDDAFFNDLTGFFRSINYAPQFYNVAHDQPEARELEIPKTLLELEGNVLFNFDPSDPQWGEAQENGETSKRDLPPGPWTWSGDRFHTDENGKYRFVYSGRDARHTKNCNAIVLEIPLSFLTKNPAEDRIVNLWGESYVRKGVNKVPTIPDKPHVHLTHPVELLHRLRRGDPELRPYKRVDTVGQPFADAALNEREDERQVGANNFKLGPHLIKRLGHLGWGFGPSITALGLATSFDHDNSPVSVHKTYDSPVAAFPRVRKTLFQQLNMPDDSWNPKGLDIPLRRTFEIFVPNVCAIDVDTTGTWPYGRRLEDQVATRFLSLFLDMSAEVNGRKYHIELLGDPALWEGAPVVNPNVPNPLTNDKDFLTEFPYLAEPWPDAKW